jgi:hypothetical protein
MKIVVICKKNQGLTVVAFAPFDKKVGDEISNVVGTLLACCSGNVFNQN